MTPVEQIAQLEAQKQKILSTTKDEILAKITGNLDELAALGFKFSINQDGAKTPRKCKKCGKEGHSSRTCKEA